MSGIIDSIVKISINDAISGVKTVDVNTMAMFGSADKGATGEFSSLEGIKNEFGEGSQLAKMAGTFFAQDSQPQKVVCVKAAAGQDVKTALEAAANFDFYHVCVAGDNDLKGVDLLKGLQDYAATNHKVIHLQLDEAEATLMQGLKAYSADRIAIYLHSAEDEFLNVALVASRCALDSAKGTFAHKKVKSVTSDNYSKDRFDTLIESGVNIYTTVAGEARTFMGTTCDDTHFIDNVVKDDWIRFNVQSRIMSLLGEANDGAGVTYDDAGIASVAASVLNVLNTAADTTHQYIMENSANVDYKPYSYLIENYKDDVLKRNLPLIKGKYARMGAIHTVNTVTLTVTL